jgi:hypothetical protein
MVRHAQRFGLVLVLSVLAALPAAAQDSVAGTWLLTVSSPDMGTMELTVMLAQEGTEVTGSADLSAIPEIDDVLVSEGLYEDRFLSFILDVSVQGQRFATEVEADVDGDEMSGEIYVPDMGYAIPFSGTRQES